MDKNIEMTDSSQAVITQFHNHTFLLIYEENELVECHPIEENKSLKIGNIYIGRVEKIVKNIQSAFVRLDDENVGYLPLDDSPAIVLNRQLPKGLPSISQNDLLLVQVLQEPQKMKQARITSNITFRGNYVVLDLNEEKKGISKKIKKKEVSDYLKSFLDSDLFITTTKDLNIFDKKDTTEFSYGTIFRTACEDANVYEIIEEYKQLVLEFDTLIRKSTFERNIGCIKTGKEEYLSLLEEYGNFRIREIRTDLPQVANHLNSIFSNIFFYEDEDYPFYKLLGLDTEFKKILNKKVWLKSGGFLVIEPTEAMVVIDVNSGKSVGKKRKETHIFETNMEAASEILKQIRLRNLSGIIMVDFINMEEDFHKKELAHFIEKELKNDKVPSYLVEITKLGLYEMTRKKVRKPIYEVLYNI